MNINFSCFNKKDSLVSKKEISVSFGELAYDPKHIAYQLNHIDSLDKLEINKIIYQHHDVILDYNLFFNNPDYRGAAQKAFTNEQFLLCLLAAIPSLHLSDHQIICCNKLAYDYVQYMNDEKNRTSDLLMQLSSIVNRNLVLVLSGIVGTGPAQYLALVARSSFSDQKTVRRILNFLIFRIEGYSTQDLLNIYQKLFNRITVFFIEAMDYVIDPEVLTEEQYKNDQTITISLLDIMMNMTSDNIRTMLREYGMNYFLYHQGCPVRISLHHLNESCYGRILKVVREFDHEEEIIIL